MNNSTKKYLLRIFLFFQLNLNWKWCLTKGGGSEDIKHSRIKFTTKMKFRWSILCWKKHHKSKRAKPPKVVRMPTMSTHQHECIVQSYEHLVFSALSWRRTRTKWVFVCVKFPETHWDTLYWFPKWCLFAIIFSIPDSRPFIDRKVLRQLYKMRLQSRFLRQGLDSWIETWSWIMIGEN